MWVFTKYGFISAVRHHTKKEVLVVRARDPFHLANIFNCKKVIQTQWSDYPYRIEITDKLFAQHMLKHMLRIDYPNFKDSINDERYKRFATDVWLAGVDFENDVHGSRFRFPDEPEDSSGKT